MCSALSYMIYKYCSMTPRWSTHLHCTDEEAKPHTEVRDLLKVPQLGSGGIGWQQEGAALNLEASPLPPLLTPRAQATRSHTL